MEQIWSIYGAYMEHTCTSLWTMASTKTRACSRQDKSAAPAQCSQHPRCGPPVAHGARSPPPARHHPLGMMGHEPVTHTSVEDIVPVSVVVVVVVVAG